MSGDLDPDAADRLRALGLRIRTVRVERRLSPIELASAIGVPPHRFAAVEAGREEIAVDDLFQIAAALGMTAAELVAPLDG